MLPEKFIDNMTLYYGKEELNRFLSVLDKPMYKCLRVNTLKISPEEFLAITPFKLEPVPWCETAFYYDQDVNPAKHPYYYAGLYYLQEPSATLPASVLPIDEGDRVLDLCAAPGGKSTRLGEKLKGTGVLVSNDISASRAKALLKNIELFGIGNSVITTENSGKLLTHFEGFFDKILIDAPCSGEGMFRKSASMITAWENNGIKTYTDLQTVILRDAVKMLRPGGSILYSTCTYNPFEDERMVEYLMNLDKSLKLCDISLHDGFMPGIPENGLTGDESLKKTVHLFPHRVKGEGHFVSLLKSNSENVSMYDIPYSIKTPLKDEYAKEFLNNLNTVFEADRLEVDRDKLYYIPRDIPDVKGLRVMRRGLFIGEIKKNRFEPSQALAMTLKNSSFKNCLDLSVDDMRVIKYLKGETIEGDVSDGTVLVMVSGFPLGFAKAKDKSLKNKYLPGWRMM